MDPIETAQILSLLLAPVIAFWLHHRQRLQSLLFWRDTAASCGLQVVEMGPPLRARAGAVEVRFEASETKDKSLQISIVAPGPPDFCKVRIRPQAAHSYQYQWVPEIEIGDARFDGTFYIEGPIRLVSALLDARMRHLLLFANASSRLEISLGELRAVISPLQLSSLLPCLLEVGQRLAQPMDVLRRLTENAHGDPEPGVRLRSLLVLARELPGEPWTVEALRTACSDPSPEVRLRAAQELGAEGRDVLLNLAKGLEDDACSAQAVSHLGRNLRRETLEAILFEALRRRRVQTARVCLEALGQSGDAAALDALAKVVALEKGELAPAAALALGATGSPAAEPPLLQALQREEADLRIAAATALGRVGSVAAVLPLKEAAERSWLDLELRRATRQAIAGIQSRLQGASPGQLSLAETEAGQLSLAPFEAGRLSLATDPAGQLSLPPKEPGARQG